MKSNELTDNGYTEFGDAGGALPGDQEFDDSWSLFQVWLKDGVFYWTTDGGCSCHLAFEDHSFPDDFTGHGNAHDAIKALHDFKYPGVEFEGLLVKLMDHRPAKPIAA